MLVTDWGEIEALHTIHHTAKSSLEAVQQSISQSSVDMSMAGKEKLLIIGSFHLTLIVC